MRPIVNSLLIIAAAWLVAWLVAWLFTPTRRD